MYQMKGTALRKLGERIRELRKERRFSQEELADVAGLHRTYIGGVERGERNVGFLNLVRIASALGVSPSELLTGLRGHPSSRRGSP